MTSLSVYLLTDMNLEFWYEIYIWNTTNVYCILINYHNSIADHDSCNCLLDEEDNPF